MDRIKSWFLLCVLIALPGFSAWASPWPDEGHLTVGHRGTPLLADENTLAAFQVAYDHGLHMFECDPRLTADGVYVIMHDADVSRTTDGSGKVSELTLAEIKQLRTASGHEVPTLAEALAFARDHDMSVYLDIKAPPGDGGELLVTTIEEADMVDRVIVGCWHVSTCLMVKKRQPELSLCISWPYPALTLGMARAVGAEAVGTLTELASPAMIRLAHAYGLKVITMPINDPEELQKFIDRGLDGLQSDDPRLLAPYGKNPG